MRSRLRVFLLVFCIIIASLVLTAPLWFSALGRALVNTAAPRRADAALVLAGDWSGNRILKGCELARDGFVNQVLISGPARWYGINEADAAIRFAVDKGCTRSVFVPVYIEATSTVEEARKIRPEIERRGIKSMLLVTSNFHTARAYRVFRRHFGDALEITPVAAPSREFDPDEWWQSREGQKAFYFEASKTAADWIGL